MCRRYTARQAMDMGLVNAVVPDDKLDAEVAAWCAELVLQPHRHRHCQEVLQCRQRKHSRHRRSGDGPAPLPRECRIPGRGQGVNEKRPPRFQGRPPAGADGWIFSLTPEQQQIMARPPGASASKKLALALAREQEGAIADTGRWVLLD